VSERSVKSAERTLAVLELFSFYETGLTVGDVARELGIPQPSVTMLLQAMRRMGYLDYDSRARLYMPTIRVLLLGSWIYRRLSVAASLAARLSELKDKLGGETTYAAIQNGAKLQYVLTLQADMPERLHVASGNRTSLVACAAGRILLSLKSDEVVRGWLRRANVETSDAARRISESAYLELMAQIRRDGFAATNGDARPGMGAVAVAVPSPMGEMHLAIGIGGPIERVLPRRAETIEALLQFRQDFSSAVREASIDRNDELPSPGDLHYTEAIY